MALNAFTDAEKAKLAAIEDGAEVNNITDVDATALTAGAETALHSHAPVASIFGSEFKSQEDTTFRSTNSTSFQQGQRLSTAVLPTGKYRIAFLTIHRVNSSQQEVGVRVQINDSITLFGGQQFNKEQRDSGSVQREHYSGFDYHEIFVPTALNIDIDYKSSAGGNSAELFYTRIEIWRIA